MEILETITIIYSIIFIALATLFMLVQVIGRLSDWLEDRHYEKYHNFDTVWFYISDFLDPFIL